MTRSRGTFSLLLALGLAAATIPASAQSGSTKEAKAGPATQLNVPTTAENKLSQAERILRLEEMIQETQAELAGLKTELDNPQSEYAQAKEAFTRLDKRLKEREAEAASQPADQAPNLDGLRKARELAKERFDLAIAEHTAMQQKCGLLEKKLRQDSEALERLKNPVAIASQPAAPIPPTGAAPESPGSEQPGPAPAAQPALPQATVKVPTVPSVTPPVAPETKAAPETGPEPQPKTAPANKELIEAKQKAQESQVEAKQAEEELQSLSERIATLRENIQTEEKLLETARQRARNAQQSYANIRDHVQNLISSGAPAEEVSNIWKRVDEAESRSGEAENDVNKQAERLDELKSELAELQGEHIAALEEAESKRVKAASDQKRLKDLENPFSLFNVLQWLIIHGPPLLGIILGIAALLWMIKIAEHRIVKLIALRGDSGTEPEREARAKTLASVFRNVGSTAIIVGGLLMILTEVGINIVPLLGAAGVVGLAVAFGAQSLIKDYFSGFIILLENQYRINDVIRIGDISGVVEHISLRMTVLRDLEGGAHFIPHGEIKSVTNMTHGWSRAVFNVSIAHKERVDEVMKVLMDLGNELYRDPGFRPLLLDSPEMLGVDAIGDSAVVIRFVIKTRPLRQWTVKREMLRRIKNRFDELGIEIPFPHRTVYHRYESDDGSNEDGVMAPLPSRTRS